jgi:prepilin-type N-terminal cleavage/methylation domain-containing protein
MSRIDRQRVVRRAPDRRPRAFTLAELLVAMAIIAVLASVTVVSARGITKDAKLSSGVNAVAAALDNARAMAMKNNRIVLVAFRARFDGRNEQVIEAVTAQWSGVSYPLDLNGDNIIDTVVDRFTPISDVPPRELPKGIKIAAPLYGGDVDFAWTSSTDLPAVEFAVEAAGVVIASMYAPDGTLITQNPTSDSTRVFVDFNNDGYQRQAGGDFSNYGSDFPDNANYCYLGNDNWGSPLVHYFCQANADDEPYLTMAPFLAVFDDDTAREQYDTTQWSDGQVRRDNLTFYISRSADRIHFNRYTGVVMR